MVFAFVGDSTTTSAPPAPVPFPAAVPLARERRFGLVVAATGEASVCGASTRVAAAAALARERRFGLVSAAAGEASVWGVSVFTSCSLAVTHQPFINSSDRHLYHPAIVCASLTTSAATCAAVLLSVSIFSCA